MNHGNAHPPRIEYLRVRNYRALRDIELANMTPLSVFVGPNGSGKSTVFDVLAFLSQRFAISGEVPDEQADKGYETLASPDLLAVNTLGQFEKHPRVRALREFITGRHLSYLSAQDPRGTPDAGPQEHLSETGDNLANVIQYLREQHSTHLDRLISTLCRRVPRLEKIEAEILADGRLLLQIKDSFFEQPILAKYASDGTIKMLAYLVLMNDPEPAPLIGIEEPENFLHPRLLRELAEECAQATRHSQRMVPTHSPFFLNALSPDQLRILSRHEDGYTRAVRAADIEGIQAFVDANASLGDLWMEGHFGVEDALAG